LLKRPRIKCCSLLNLWMPNLYITVLVSKDNLNLVWMKHCTINLNTCVLILSLESFTFEIKCFESSILACSKKPLVVFLEIHCHHVTIMSIKGTFLIWVPEIINFHMSICTSSKIFLILTQNKSIDCIFSKFL